MALDTLTSLPEKQTFSSAASSLASPRTTPASNRPAYVTLALVLGVGMIVILAEMLLSASLVGSTVPRTMRPPMSGPSTYGMMSGVPSSNIHLAILPQRPNSTIQGPAYSQTGLTVPAHALITITIVNDDPGDTALPNGSPFAHVTGVTGGVAYINGQAYSGLDVTKVAHTFTIPQLGVNVPIPGDIPAGQNAITVTFSFRTGAAGMFTWQCMDPCGSGASGWEGPMATMGYMQGMLMVR